jgi:hypothetical protein
VDFGDLHEHYWKMCASLRVLRGLTGGGQIETFLENNFFEVFRKKCLSTFEINYWLLGGFK